MEDIVLWSLGTVISLGAAITGWVFKMVFAAIQQVEQNNDKLAEALSAHKIHAAETFATKQDVRDGFDRVMNKLDKIDEKLDGKADKE